MGRRSSIVGLVLALAGSLSGCCCDGCEGCVGAIDPDWDATNQAAESYCRAVPGLAAETGKILGVDRRILGRRSGTSAESDQTVELELGIDGDKKNATCTAWVAKKAGKWVVVGAVVTVGAKTLSSGKKVEVTVPSGGGDLDWD